MSSPASSQNGTCEPAFNQAYVKQQQQWKRNRRASETVVFDDGTNTFFWRAHTVLVLLLVVSILVYAVFFEDESVNLEYNVKRGIVAAVLMYYVIGLSQVKDGPFLRPHPLLWRYILCSSVLYELGILFILFQNSADARFFLTYFDPELNKPLDFRAYGGSCDIWDPGHPDGPLHNVMDKMDGFVVAHFIGWFSKALILRDMWMTTVISLTFELLEYTFEHQLPNFSECWWDHWIMDFLICNGLGIYFGLKYLRYLSIKEYRWQGLWHIRSYKGKVRRVVGQFSPYSWVKFSWKPTENLVRWLLVSFIIFMFLIAELNTFYLKFVMWVPPNHPFVLTRLVFLILWGAVAVREMYDYMGGITKKFGQQSWILAVIIVTELLIVVKFGKEVIYKPVPSYIRWFWTLALLLLVCWTVWKFQMRFPRIKAYIREMFSKAEPETDVMTSNSESTDQDSEASKLMRRRKTVKEKDSDCDN